MNVEKVSKYISIRSGVSEPQSAGRRVLVSLPRVKWLEAQPDYEPWPVLEEPAPPPPDPRPARYDCRPQARNHELTARQKQAWALHSEGRAHKEIAQILGSTTNAVGKLLEQRMTKFKAGEWYKTRLGWRAYVYETHFREGSETKITGKIISPEGCYALAVWDMDGRTLKDQEHYKDLILPYEVWLNVYPDVISCAHDSRGEADASNGLRQVFDRVGVVKVYVENSKIFTEVHYD